MKTSSKRRFFFQTSRMDNEHEVFYRQNLHFKRVNRQWDWILKYSLHQKKKSITDYEEIFLLRMRLLISFTTGKCYENLAHQRNEIMFNQEIHILKMICIFRTLNYNETTDKSTFYRDRWVDDLKNVILSKFGSNDEMTAAIQGLGYSWNWTIIKLYKLHWYERTCKFDSKNFMISGSL